MNSESRETSAISLVPRVGVCSISSPLEIGADRAPQAADDLSRRLAESGCEIVAEGAIGTPEESVAAGRRFNENQVDAIAIAPASWCEDYLVTDLIEECSAPISFWPLPGMETGALCGTQQMTCFLKQLGHPYNAVFGEIDDQKCLDRTLVFLRGAALKSRLRRARIGLAGNHVNGMTHPAPNEFALKRVLGPRVVPLDVPMMLQRAEEMPDDEAEQCWGRVVHRAGKCTVPLKDGVDSTRIYAAMRELVAEHGLTALTVGCYPHLMGRVCLSSSLLADEGIPMACEGDVHGAVCQYILMMLTGQPTHNTDWLDPLDDDTVIFSHCGLGSFSLAESGAAVTLEPVRLMDQGVCALFTGKPGPVTMLDLTATTDGYQCAVMEGEALPTEMVFPGNPVRVRFKKPLEEVMHWIHREGIGHHWMIGYGHVGAELRAWAGIVGDGLRFLS
ncbi:MAG: hypothetical protein OXN17_13550 [Candidatus Poribacteria bacterium]|nr:hypothetical protein [Candidatus Poribacteria bacterium]